MERLKKLEPDFRAVEEEAKASREAVTKPRHSRSSVLPDNCIYAICGPLWPRCRGKAEQPPPFLGRYRVSLAGKGGMTALDNVKAFLGRYTRSEVKPGSAGKS